MLFVVVVGEQFMVQRYNFFRKHKKKLYFCKKYRNQTRYLMDIKIEANFHFSVSSIQYMPDGELRIALVQDDPHEGKKYL